MDRGVCGDAFDGGDRRCSQCLAVRQVSFAWGLPKTDGRVRPKDALIHCLTVSKPDIIFLDADRAAVLAGSAAALSDKGVGEVNVSFELRSRADGVRCSAGQVPPLYPARSSEGSR